MVAHRKVECTALLHGGHAVVCVDNRLYEESEETGGSVLRGLTSVDFDAVDHVFKPLRIHCHMKHSGGKHPLATALLGWLCCDNWLRRIC